MCGITGFVNLKESSAKKQIISKMTKTLYHRGPDDQGTFIADNIALGVRRLSIIDLIGGHQPIFNENKNVIVVFNGEIYNFGELRAKLIRKKHQFQTKSDTEVIAHLYEEVGERLFERLNGMFAVAIWDRKRRKLLLGRDRFGEKPLYYGIFGQTFVFGSELKSLLSHPKVKKELDYQSLNRYLTFEYVPAPYSIFKKINKLKPGCYLVLEKNKIKINSYWTINFEKFKYSSEEEILEQLDAALARAVKLRLVADVPLGIFLSGGIDSSTIAYYAAENSVRKVKSFTIGFEEESFDERQYAAEVASYLGLEHHQETFQAKDLINLIPEVTKVLDEPFADASILPTFLLSKFTREKVKVALGGDGGDELFMGYPTFQAHRLASIYTLIPKLISEKLILPLVNKLPASYANFSFDFKVKRILMGIYEQPLVRNHIWLGAFNFQKIRQTIFSKQILSTIEMVDPIEESIEQNQTLQFKNWNDLIYQYLTTYLTDDILAKTDRASMANSLEVRAPFLDDKLVDIVNSIPSNLKLAGFTTKYILKKLMEKKLPSKIIYRPKHGFGIPIGQWLRKDLKNFLLTVLDSTKLKKEGIFNSKFVDQLVREHLTGKKDNRKLLWTLVMFELWQENWA